MNVHTRRQFLADVGKGMLVASVGTALAADLGLARAMAGDEVGRLAFGAMEPLVSLMQETPPDKLLPELAKKLRGGTDLKTLVAAGALANARSFGGNDYIGFHTFMALMPAYGMSQELPESQRALPVLKVLYRNAARIQAVGGASHEVLKAIEAAELAAEHHGGQLLQDKVHTADYDQAERAFAAIAQGPAGEAFNHLQYAVDEEAEVHRVVLAWRAWDTLGLTGQEHAHTLLRQSVRFCVEAEQRISKRQNPSPIRTLLPKLLDQYKLLGRSLGTRQADDAWINETANKIYAGSREQAAEIAAAALADGIAPDDIGQALCLAANALLLHDPGRPKEWSSPEKPIGSVHGDSIGVHASDSANAWRNIARASNHRNTLAALIVGAFHTGGQTSHFRGDPPALEAQLEKITAKDAATLVSQLDAAVREKDQLRACALVQRYGELGGEPRPIFDTLLRYGVTEDGALHAEKYYRTVSEEFDRGRPAFRWRHLAGLARVTASEYGREAPGIALAKDLVKG